MILRVKIKFQNRITSLLTPGHQLFAILGAPVTDKAGYFYL